MQFISTIAPFHKESQIVLELHTVKLSLIQCSYNNLLAMTINKISLISTAIIYLLT